MLTFYPIVIKSRVVAYDNCKTECLSCKTAIKKEEKSLRNKKLMNYCIYVTSKTAR